MTATIFLMPHPRYAHPTPGYCRLWTLDPPYLAPHASAAVKQPSVVQEAILSPAPKYNQQVLPGAVITVVPAHLQGPAPASTPGTPHPSQDT
jgi:hypothetical protein